MEYIREAGWPVFLVLALGITALTVAVRYAVTPQRGVLTLIVGLGVASLLMAAFGTAVGLDTSIDGITRVEPERRWIVLIGLKESMRNIEFALLLAVPTALCATVGAYRLRALTPDTSRSA